MLHDKKQCKSSVENKFQFPWINMNLLCKGTTLGFFFSFSFFGVCICPICWSCVCGAIWFHSLLFIASRKAKLSKKTLKETAIHVQCSKSKVRTCYPSCDLVWICSNTSILQ